ncbi:MAG TPA: hypothetical protein DCQ26_19355 [Marinilabiliales bacterium]|jgi:hypothetical protein|nr:MAG: hypothetical protein A2W95_11355 [Bacteroidetes bacterium GWA2_40_14]OFZ26490.1 MAG: hypothetical protein A2437_07285 [Bacteroidetes bacterium RIFOXYC2_FULL_40_12]HAN00757.1 hypothetical protein [Marinilabiliales bacterium]HAZ02343.1 hypothetical protein [Marinilabiliales bacterium]HBO75408.1 hypothetical protein [Marinilabiliales bacterium]
MRQKIKSNLLNTKLFFIVSLLVLLLPGHSNIFAQCGLALKDVVLKEIGKATYLKDFRVRLEEGKNNSKPPSEEFTILLNKGTHYRFNIKADSTCEDQVILKLYDFNKFYGSNFDQADGTSYEFFDFFCAKTQVYYLAISFAEARPGCAAAIVSFVENYNAN